MIRFFSTILHHTRKATLAYFAFGSCLHVIILFALITPATAVVSGMYKWEMPFALVLLIASTSLSLRTSYLLFGQGPLLNYRSFPSVESYRAASDAKHTALVKVFRQTAAWAVITFGSTALFLIFSLKP